MTQEVPAESEGRAGFFSRRLVLTSAGSAALGFVAGWVLHDLGRGTDVDEALPNSAREALERLETGNQRFVSGQVRRRHQSRMWRHGLVPEQHPFATILGCSDSRVPIELVFDQGFGDLFVVRVAGNVVAPDILGSVAYAVAHVHTPLVVILGHEGCGAVTAALKEKDRHGEPQRLEELLRLIDPGLRDLDPRLAGPARLSAAVEANVRWSMRQLTELAGARRLIAGHALEVAGAVYDLDSGKVRLLS
jgi:carbonic anhydrase